MNRLNSKNRTGPAQERFSPVSALEDGLVVLFGLTASASLHFVGDLPVAEVLVLFLLLPLFVVYRNRALRPDLLVIYAGQMLWLGNQVLTDMYRRTPQVDWMRGDAAILFFMMDLAFVAMLMAGNQRRKILFVIALSIGSILSITLWPTDYSDAEPWKFGYAMGVNLLVILAGSFFYNRRRYLVTLLLLLGICAVNLADNYRSPVLLILLTITLTIPVIPEYVGRWRVLPPIGSRMRLLVLVALAAGGGLLAAGAVSKLAAAGYLGQDAQDKNEIQSHVKGGLLIGGRPEILVSSRAVFDSPILGHGSWAKDYHYIEIMHDVMFRYGLERQEDVDSMESDSEGLIPAHSHLMGAWVWAGLAGGVFWLYVLWLVLKAIFHLSLKPQAFSPLSMFLCIGNVWDILFSPFGSSQRIIEAFLIVLTLDLLRTLHVPETSVSWMRRGTWTRGQFAGRMPAAPRNR